MVSAITKDLLTSPVSIVDLESAFGACKRVLSEIMTQLKEDILEVLIRVKDDKTLILDCKSLSIYKKRD